MSSSPRELGFSAGRLLLARQPVLEGIYASLDGARRQKLADARSRLSGNAAKRADTSARRLQLESRADSLQGQLAAIFQDRVTEPAKSSIPRALFYGALGCCAIVGDIAFLGGILGPLLSTPFLGPNGESFASILLTQPAEVMRMIPDLTLLTISRP